MKFTARSINGELQVENPGKWEDFLLKHDGEVLVGEVHSTTLRTGRQNRFLWGYVYEELLQKLEADTGQPKEDYHDYFKAKFLKRFVLGEKVGVGSTTELTKEEFAQYIGKVKEAASVEFGVYIE